MKELSIEEKAKRYDEALEKARQLYAYPTSKPFISDLQDLFPELKERKNESKNESIRKGIIKSMMDLNADWIGLHGVTKEDAIAWLEKQGQSNPYSGVSFRYNGHTWGMCARDNGVDILLDKQLFKHLDKQDEQTTEIPFGAKDSELQEATYHIPEGYHAEINGNEVIIKQGEQKTTWKPTEEQIEALEHFLETIRRYEYSYFHEETFLCLHSLLEQLKKL